MAYDADKKPSELTALTSLDDTDTVIVGDTSDASEVVKAITWVNIKTAVQTYVEGLASYFNVTTDDSDAITEGAANLFLTTSERSKLAGIETAADVTDATNVDAAGAVMNSDTSTASMSFVIDEDNMASDSATKVPTQQSVKAYVDANSGSGATQLSELSDVTLTTLGTDELLFTQDGSTFINQTLAEAGIQAVLTEGAFVNGDKTKLDGIETAADVTDTTNVTAAGALMDSEVTNLAAVKAFDPTDYATAAQGATADTATQPGDNVSTLTNDAGYITGSSPTITTPTITLKQGTAPTPTAEGDIQWDTDDNKLKIGDGTGTKTFSDDSYNASTFAAASHTHTEADITDLGAYIENVVEDTTPQLGGSLDVNGNKIVSTANGNIDIEPNGTGNVLLGNFTLDADQTVGAGQDNYVMTYDNATGLISLEAATGGSGDNVSIDGVGVTDPDFVSTGDIDFVDTSNTITANINSGAVDIAHLSATGTPSSSTYLRGDNTWSTPAGSGDVSKVGTPVDQQVGVWTGDGTIEGSTELTFINSGDSAYTVPQLAIGGTTNQIANQLHIEVDGTALGIGAYRHQDSVGDPAFYFGKSRGTGASPTAALSGDGLGQFRFYGYDGTSYENTANFQAVTTENLGASNEGTKLVFEATANGATTRTAYLTIGGSVDVDLAASTDLSWAGTAILSDSAGTMTLSNIDAIDATTETTLEAAIDSLSNLTVVGTVTSGNVDAVVSAASDTAAGKVELATIAETNTGTDTGRAVTPDGLAGSYAGTKPVGAYVVAAGTAVSTGDGKCYFPPIPASLNGMNLVSAVITVITAGTTGTTDVQIHNVTQAADMLSTKLTIDSTETSSSTAATPAVIDTANDDVATGDVLRVDVDAVSTTPPQGLLITLEFRLP